MRLSAVVLLIATSGVLLIEGMTIKTLVFPNESSNSYAELIPKKSMGLEAFTLCMRVGTELRGNREIILFAYRTSAYDALNVWREGNGSISLYLSGPGISFNVPEIGSLLTEICVTWDSRSGAAAVFVDGKQSLTQIYRKGHKIPSGGRVILGQDPDRFLDQFDAKQSFVGEIYDVNLWDYVLPHITLYERAHWKRGPWGNVIDWLTTEIKPQADVHIIERELM